MIGQTATGAYMLKVTRRGPVAEVAPESVSVGAIIDVTDEQRYPHARQARVTGLGRVFRVPVSVIDEDWNLAGIRPAGSESVQYAYLTFDLAPVAAPAPKAPAAAAIAPELSAAERRSLTQTIVDAIAAARDAANRCGEPFGPERVEQIIAHREGRMGLPAGTLAGDVRAALR